MKVPNMIVPNKRSREERGERVVARREGWEVAETTIDPRSAHTTSTVKEKK